MLSSSGDKHPADNRRCFHKTGDVIWHTVYLNKMAALENTLLQTVVMAGANSAVMTSCGLWNHLWSLGIVAAIHILRIDPAMLSGTSVVLDCPWYFACGVFCGGRKHTHMHIIYLYIYMYIYTYIYSANLESRLFGFLSL